MVYKTLRKHLRDSTGGENNMNKCREGDEEYPHETVNDLSGTNNLLYFPGVCRYVNRLF